MRSSASPLAVWVGLLILYVVWGSTYLGMKLAIDTMPPFVMGFLRFVPAGLMLGAGVWIHARGSIPRPTLAQLRDAGVVGTLLLLGGTGLVAYGEQTVPTGIAALIIALVPMWLAILGRLLFGDRVPALAAVGIAVGLVGVAILAWPTGDVGSLDPTGLAVLLVAPVLWSLGTLYAAKRAVLPAPALFSTAIQMVLAGLAFLVAALVTGQASEFDLAAVGAVSWFGIGYLILVGALIGYTTYAWLLTVAPLGRISTYAYVNPVVAVFLGWLILGEALTARTMVASVVIVVAVALIVTARGREGALRRAQGWGASSTAPAEVVIAPEGLLDGARPADVPDTEGQTGDASTAPGTATAG